MLQDLSPRLVLLFSLSVVDIFQRATSSVLLALSAPRFSWALPVDHGTSGIDGQFYDIQGHRGARGEVVESTLPAFAAAFAAGVKTLEMDNGITKDGIVITWHDEVIHPTKCSDTQPVIPNDPMFPYVGKHIAELTLAQIKTLDCGSKRLYNFPLQLTVLKTRISTQAEVFAFARCVDPKREILWNIESKINAIDPTTTKGVNDFVELQLAEFEKSGYLLKSITYQSFDWRTLRAMKAKKTPLAISALADLNTISGQDGATSPWLAGLRLDSFPGPSTSQQLAQAAASIGADILSTAAVSAASPVQDPSEPGYIPFTDKPMIDEAHKLGLTVKPWTVNRLNVASQLLKWGTDGIITDYPHLVSSWAAYEKGLKVPKPYDLEAIESCLRKHS